jgi:hypothetical protein
MLFYWSTLSYHLIVSYWSILIHGSILSYAIDSILSIHLPLVNSTRRRHHHEGKEMKKYEYIQEKVGIPCTPCPRRFHALLYVPVFA